VPRLNATDAISLAFEHTKQQIFLPFRWGQWMRLAFVGLLAGELGSGGGCNFRAPGTWIPKQGKNDFLAAQFPGISPEKIGALLGVIAVFAVIAVILFVVFLYLNSVFRFILLESVVKKQCTIRASWRRWRKAGGRFFLWQLVYQIAFGMFAVILIGIPLGLAFAAGWLQQPREHLAPLVLGGIALFFIFGAFLIIALIVHTFARDFLVPLMALENLDFADGWSRLLQMLRQEKGAYAGYAGMKLVLAIAAALVFGIVLAMVVVILAVPIVLIAVAAGVAGSAGGWHWTPELIALVLLLGVIALVVLISLTALINVPAIVFFPAYAIHFFSARYEPLRAWLYPPPAPPPPATPLAPIQPAPLV
jgi:hypothetical protein